MKNRVRIARTSNLSNLSGDTLTQQVVDGQPFYDKETNKLYIGQQVQDGGSTRNATLGDFQNNTVEPINATNADNVTSTIDGHDIKGANGIFENDGITVKQATNAIKNSDDSYSGFTQDIDNILKANADEIVSKKILLWQATNNLDSDGYTEISFTDDITLLHQVNRGDILEFSYKYGESAHFAKVGVIKNPYNIPQGYDSVVCFSNTNSDLNGAGGNPPTINSYWAYILTDNRTKLKFKYAYSFNVVKNGAADGYASITGINLKSIYKIIE